MDEWIDAKQNEFYDLLRFTGSLGTIRCEL